MVYTFIPSRIQILISSDEVQICHTVGFVANLWWLLMFVLSENLCMNLLGIFKRTQNVLPDLWGYVPVPTKGWVPRSHLVVCVEAV